MVELIGGLADDTVAPPAASAVAERLLALLIMEMRVGMESRFASGDPDAVKAWEKARGVIEDVQAYLHPIERELLFDAEVGSWDADTRNDVHWLLEAQTILRWSLGGEIAQPPADEVTRPGSFGAAPLLSPRSFIDGARLRSSSELEACEAIWAFWLWRANAGPFRGRRLLPPHVREGVARAVSSAVIDPESLRDGDVIAFDTPVYLLEEEQQQLLTSMATERCRAARWLCGHADGFYEISLEVSPLWSP